MSNLKNGDLVKYVKSSWANLAGDWVTDEGLILLKNLDYLKLESCTRITGCTFFRLETITTLIFVNNSNNIKFKYLKDLNGLNELRLDNFHNLITSDFIYFSRIATVIFANCINLPDDGVGLLDQVNNLEIRGCDNITDEGIRPLKNLCHLKLIFSKNISGSSFVELRKLQSLTMCVCKRINYKYINDLRRNFKLLKQVDIRGDDNISDNDLFSLREIPKVNLDYCYKLTDAGLAYLHKNKWLSLCCNQLTDACLVHLSKIQKLTIDDCDHITGSGFVYLKMMQKITLSNCDNIMDNMLFHLRKTSKVRLIYCNNITNKGLLHLKDVDSLKIFQCKKTTRTVLANLTGVKELIYE